jgi:hypothetical protein
VSTPTELISATVCEELKAEFTALHTSTSPPCLIHPNREAKAKLLHYIGEVSTHEDSLLVDLYDSTFYLVLNFFESDEGRGIPLKCKH